MSENTADGTVETPSVEELQARLAKAEAKIVDLKVNSKTPAPIETQEVTNTEVKTSYLTDEDLDKRLEERNFLNSNPDLAEYKDSLKTYVDKWLSWEDAKTLLERNDTTFLNRAKSNSMNLTNWDSSSAKTTYTKKELEDLPTQEAYNAVKDLIDSWKATIIG